MAFSGGGVRATVFHLGVLARLAKSGHLASVQSLSTVSGGSLAAGLVLAANQYQWPTPMQYFRFVVPRIRQLLTSRDLQRVYVLSSLVRPWRLMSGRARVLGDCLARHWQIDANLADLPHWPRWTINATCYETGKNFRFGRDIMGDYQTKYVQRPSFSLAHALAASAAVPGLIGPLVLCTSKHRWSERADQTWRPIFPPHRRYHLWDGGVYDNLGVESLYKPGVGLRDDCDFLLVSDASRPLEVGRERSRFNPAYVEASMRLVDIATDQIRSLRARMLIDHFNQHPGRGVYLRMGLDTTEPRRRMHASGPVSLTQAEINQATSFETTLRRLRSSEFARLFQHGLEVADVTLGRYGSGNETSAQPIKVA
ncbi:MAG: patatin-like phospholipase family protein [Planctomycetota bacterium]